MPQLWSTANIWPLKMRVLWQLCTALSFKIEIECFKRGHFLQCCPQSIHLFEERPLPYLLGFGLVINHTVLSMPNCKSDHVTQAWPIMLPTALSPQVVCDGHKANQSLSMRSDLLLGQTKKMTSVKDSVWLGESVKPPFLLPRAKLRKSPTWVK